MVNSSKNVFTSRTAWVFVLLFVIGGLKALGLVDLELETSEVEGIALGIVAIIGIGLRFVSSKRVRILPIK